MSTKRKQNPAISSSAPATSSSGSSDSDTIAAAATGANTSASNGIAANRAASSIIDNVNNGASMALHSLQRSIKRMRADDELVEEKKHDDNKRAAEGTFGSFDLIDALAASTPDTKTANGASSFTSTSSHRLDLFFGGLIRGADPRRVQRMVAASWREGPAGARHTLQILLHARDCRGGKGEKATVLAALLWLRQHKPLTYAANLQRFIDVGYYKDLLQLASMVQSDSLSVPTTGSSSKKKSHKGRGDAIAANRTAVASGQPTTSRGRGGRGGARGGLRGGSLRGGGSRGRGGRGAAFASITYGRVTADSATSGTSDDDSQADDKAMKVNDDSSSSSTTTTTTTTDDNGIVRRSRAAVPLLGVHDLLEVEMFVSQLQRDKRAYDEYVTALAQWQAAHPKERKDDTTNSNDGVKGVDESDDVSNGKKKKKDKKRDKKKQSDNNDSKDEANTNGNNKKDDKDGDNDDKSERRPKLSLTLASKWAPTEKNSFDRRASLAKRIAILLFPANGATATSSSSSSSSPSSKTKASIGSAATADVASSLLPPLADDDIDKADSSAKSEKNGKIRSLILYRKLLTQLRAHLRVVESYMCRGDWHRIAFEGVPSRAHHALKHAFKRHQPDRYARYMEDVASGKKTIKSQGVQPHELVQRYYQGHALDDTVEAMWRAQIMKLREKGRLHRCLALSDVSSSMEGVPMMVSIALGLMVSHLAPTDSPFYRQVMTFETQPQLHRLPDTAISLHDQVASLRNAPWGGSTNIEAAFQLILDTARSGNVSADQMPKTLFIFSDMQFDVAAGNGGNGWTRTSYDAMMDAYRIAGYQLPQVVFWNLRADTVDFPVYKDAPNVALVSGFSKDLLELFMDGDEGMSPVGILLQAVADYECTIIESEL